MRKTKLCPSFKSSGPTNRGYLLWHTCVTKSSQKYKIFIGSATRKETKCWMHFWCDRYIALHTLSTRADFSEVAAQKKYKRLTRLNTIKHFVHVERFWKNRIGFIFHAVINSNVIVNLTFLFVALSVVRIWLHIRAQMESKAWFVSRQVERS